MLVGETKVEIVVKLLKPFSQLTDQNSNASTSAYINYSLYLGPNLRDKSIASLFSNKQLLLTFQRDHMAIS